METTGNHRARDKKKIHSSENSSVRFLACPTCYCDLTSDSLARWRPTIHLRVSNPNPPILNGSDWCAEKDVLWFVESIWVFASPARNKLIMTAGPFLHTPTHSSLFRQPPCMVHHQQEHMLLNPDTFSVPLGCHLIEMLWSNIMRNNKIKAKWVKDFKTQGFLNTLLKPWIWLYATLLTNVLPSLL